MLSHGATLQNRYRIERQLGQGGMGAVYEATDKRFGTPVALKEIVFATTDETQRLYMLAAFEREAKALATIQHECIPFVRDYFSEEDREYLVMELIPGDNLGHVLERQTKSFSIFETLGWLQQLLDALDYLHNLTPPIIHRDIKPHNLKVNARGRLKLLDFGIAKSEDRSGVTTRKQTFIGATLDYSPFEQLLRVMDASFREFIILKHEARANAVLAQLTDERADIFSAGATFYHLVTGRVPEDSTKRTLAVWEGAPDPLPHPSDIRPDIPRPIGDFFLKAMAINREERFASPAEMLEALNNTVLTKSGTDLLQERPPSPVQVEKVDPTVEPQNPATAAVTEVLSVPPADVVVSPPADESGAFTISNERLPSEMAEVRPNDWDEFTISDQHVSSEIADVKVDDRNAPIISNERVPIETLPEKREEAVSGFSEEDFLSRLRAEFASSSDLPREEPPIGMRTADSLTSAQPATSGSEGYAYSKENLVSPAEIGLAAPPKQSTIETFVLPASDSFALGAFGTPAQGTMGKWVGGGSALVVALASVLWLSGFLGGTAEPATNRPLTGSANVSAQPEPSPSQKDALTSASPVPAMTSTANNVPNPSLGTTAPKPKPVSQPPVAPKAKKQKAAPDLNCVYTNSCK